MSDDVLQEIQALLDGSTIDDRTRSVLCRARGMIRGLGVHLSELEVELAQLRRPRPVDEWHEDDGAVLLWRLPVTEPPYAGTPLDDECPGYVTHWTQLVEPLSPGERA